MAVRFAERVIMSELVQALSLSVRRAKEKCPESCGENGAMELAILLIGSIPTEPAAEALVSLLGLRVDGEAAEELDCQLLDRGKSLLPRLRKTRVADIVSRCRARFVSEGRGASDVSVDLVCISEADVQTRRDGIVEAIGRRAKCED